MQFDYDYFPYLEPERCGIYTLIFSFNLTLLPLTTTGLPDEEQQASDISNEQVLLNK